MNITKTLNGVNVHRPEHGWRLLASSTIRPGAAPRRTAVEIPRSHGSRSTGRPPVFGEATVRLEWELSAATQAGLEANWNDLVSLLTRPGLVYGHHVDGVDTEAPAELVSISEPGDFLVESHMTMTAILALPGVFLRSPVANSPVLAPGTHELDTWPGTGPISDAIVRFDGGALDVSVVDAAYGEGISWNGDAPILSNQYLYLDAARWRAWSSTSASAWNPAGTNRTRFLDRPPIGRLQLHPVASTSQSETVVATNLVHNANMTASSGGSTVGTASGSMVSEENVVEDGRTLSRWVVLGTGAAGINLVPSGQLPTSTTLHYVMRVRSSRSIQARARVNRVAADSLTQFPAGVWVDVVGSVTTDDSESLNTGLLLSGVTGHQVGDVIDVDRVYVGTAPHTYFDGGSPSVGAHVFRWSGTPHESVSQKVLLGPLSITRPRTVTVTGGTCIIRARGAHL